jgi:hypothetical protein
MATQTFHYMLILFTYINLAARPDLTGEEMGAGHNATMSLKELQDEVARLSPEDRAKLRAHLDSLDVFSDPKVKEDWTRQNRAAAAGAVVPREEAIARLKAARKQREHRKRFTLKQLERRRP